MRYAAARGWLIAGALLWAGEVAAQGPESQRVPQPAPAVEGQAQREAQRGNRPAEPPPVPVRIIQSPDEAAHDAAREAKSDEHEANDLAAQRKAADAAADSAASAYGQVIAAFVGIFFSLVGTGLLVWTLRETRRTAQAAIDGAFAAERAALAAAFGKTIFPDQKIRENNTFTIRWMDIDAEVKISQRFFSDDRICPVLLGCYAYYSGINDLQHQTGFIFQFVKLPEDSNCFIPSEGDIPIERLRLSRWDQEGAVD